MASCGQKDFTNMEQTPEIWKRMNVKYTVMPGDSIQSAIKNYTPQQQKIIMSVNRADMSNLAKLDTVIIPDALDGQVAQYLPFPQHVPAIKDIKKIVYFSYPSQTFAAYENGWLAYTGPTSMGRKNDPTPAGLYFANWKAEETISTFNDEWELKWNFNIENKEGIGWHQYSLPGYPASHSCLRMLEEDAKHMYQWADEWELKGTDNVLAKGTPVIVFGTYPFDGKKPWLHNINNPRALDISAGELEKVTKPYLNEILKEQQNTAAVKAKAATK